MIDYRIQIEIDGYSDYLDLYSDNINVEFTFDIADVKNLTGRNSSYSYPIKVPATDRNRQIFGYVNELSKKLEFDPRKQLRGYYFRNSILVFDGYIKYEEFVIDDGDNTKEFSLIFYGDNDTIYNRLNGKFLSDLDLSSLDHKYHKNNIIESWTDSVGYPYRYPLIDYGYNWTIENISGNGGTAGSYVDVEEMFPAISKKLIFDRIMQEAGLNYESDELNSDDFKNEYIPFNGSKLENTRINDNLFKARSVGQTMSSGLNTHTNLKFTNEISDPDGVWNTTFSRFENNTGFGISTRFNINLNIEILSDPGSEVKYTLDVIGPSGVVEESILLLDCTGPDFVFSYPPNTVQLSSTTANFFYTTKYYNVVNGFQFVYFRIQRWGNDAAGGNIKVMVDSSVRNENDSTIREFGLISMSSILPKKIKQLDFISSVIIERNLMIEPIKNMPNSFLIEPRDKYYSIGDVKDWSKKLDNNKEIIEKAIADDKDRFIRFTHKEDKDYYNNEYKQQFGEAYGEFTFDTGNEHTKSVKTIQTIFSPTPLVNVPGSINFPIPIITKDAKTSYNETGQGRLETNIRCLYWGGFKPFYTSPIPNTFDRFCFRGQVFEGWPYMGHLSDPYSPTQSIDLNFGEPIDVYFYNNGVTDDNLYKRYWERTILELADKDSKLVTCYLKLSPNDIYDLKFNHKIWLEIGGNGQYYRLNKIFSFNPNTLEPCKVELIRARDVIVPPKKVIKQVKPIRPNLPTKDTPNDIPGPIRTGPIRVEPDTTNVPSTLSPSSNGISVSGDGGNVSGINDGYLMIGDNIRAGSFNDNMLLIGSSQSVADSNENLVLVGNNITVGSYSQNVTIYGNDVQVGSEVENVFSVGDGLTITQSNTNYIGGNTIFSGTVSFNSPNFSLNCLNIEKFNLADVDQTFLSNLGTGFNNDVNTIEVQTDGKIVIGGSFTTFNGNTRNRLVRLNSDGTEDTSFYTNLGTGFSFGNVFHVNIQSDGKIVVCGNFLFLNGVARVCLVRLNSDGTQDTSFYTNLGTSFNSTVNEVHIQSDGKILVGGQFTSLNGTTRNRLVRLNSNGTVDTSFYTNMGTAFGNNGVNTITLQSDGKILVGGSFTSFNGNTRNRLVRLNSDGTEDTSFYTNLGTGFGSFVNIALEQPDGKILVGGGFFTLNGNSRNNLVRLNSDGTEDIDFFNNYTGLGQVNDINLLSDGGIVLAGNIANNIMRLDSDGVIDSNFMRKLPLGFNGTTNKAFILSDDSILVGGLFSSVDVYTANYFTKLSYVSACEYVNGSDFITIGAVDSEIDILGKSLDINSDSININTDSFQVNSLSTILNSTQSFVLGGDNNDITDLVKTGIICLDNITATQSDTVYLPNVKMYGDAFIQGRLDLTKLVVESILRIIPSGATPSTPLVGDVFYRDGVGLYYWNGTKWVVIGTTPVEFNQLSGTQSLTVNNTTSALTNITGWTFSFDANSYYQFEGYIDASITSPALAGPNTQNFIGLCIDFTNSITHYNLTITDIQNLYASTWGAADSVYHIGNSRSSNTINSDAIIRGTTGRMKIEGFVRTSAATTGQFKWTYRNDTTRTFNILSGSVINIIKV